MCSLIVAYEAGNHLHRYGARVYADGRYEQFSTSHPGETPRWEAFEPFGLAIVEAFATATPVIAARFGAPDVDDVACFPAESFRVAQFGGMGRSRNSSSLPAVLAAVIVILIIMLIVRQQG